jgi:hypothetical protein
MITCIPIRSPICHSDVGRSSSNVCISDIDSPRTTRALAYHKSESPHQHRQNLNRHSLAKSPTFSLRRRRRHLRHQRPLPSLLPVHQPRPLPRQHPHLRYRPPPYPSPRHPLSPKPQPPLPSRCRRIFASCSSRRVPWATRESPNPTACGLRFAFRRRSCVPPCVRPRQCPRRYVRGDEK